MKECSNGWKRRFGGHDITMTQVGRWAFYDSNSFQEIPRNKQLLEFIRGFVISMFTSEGYNPFGKICGYLINEKRRWSVYGWDELFKSNEAKAIAKQSKL